MASFQLQSSQGLPAPQVLGEEHHEQLLDFLSADVAANLFQLCWLENNGVRSQGRPELYHFAGIVDPTGRLLAASLVIADRLLLVDALDDEHAASLARWYRRRELVLEHIVSAHAAVRPFWCAYRGTRDDLEVIARLNRDQELYVLERDRWYDHLYADGRPRYERTGVERAHIEQLEPIFLASARMHLEETLEDPLQAHPEAFRRHVRHRILAERSFGWFDEHRRLIFKADLSASSSFGTQISGVYTPPRFRGQGIATRALFDICEDLFESGLPRITLYVNAENEAARRVYRKVGFQFHADYQTVFVESFPQP
ncbi:MAG: GNAT family N-acetyltransferase [Persicimonas sp.]